MAGYSSNSLSKKLGLKAGLEVCIMHAPEDYAVLTADIYDQLIFKKEGSKELDFIHLFTNSFAELKKQLPKLKTQIKKNGMIWISWYKKSAGKPTELTENMIRDTALAIGLVDVKVCAVDEDWSGLKLVFRIVDR
ncbi:DUF3052 family protein [Taibaiella soli]|uniref:DUF3052 domain-containing protein n=1 Tax=Taibaiella soli TaxID=1649169 RepID=A0A2W2AJ64_9BACT|nr:DUF3052 family protein [Taibaiella soli]PZF72290.1 DUF3052 domain-containing protein [Taibaiella soli]